MPWRPRDVGDAKTIRYQQRKAVDMEYCWPKRSYNTLQSNQVLWSGHDSSDKKCVSGGYGVCPARFWSCSGLSFLDLPPFLPFGIGRFILPFVICCKYVTRVLWGCLDFGLWDNYENTKDYGHLQKWIKHILYYRMKRILWFKVIVRFSSGHGLEILTLNLHCQYDWI